MLSEQIKECLIKNNKTPTINFKLSINNIERMQVKGLLKKPTYCIANNHYFYFNDNNC